MFIVTEYAALILMVLDKKIFTIPPVLPYHFPLSFFFYCAAGGGGHQEDYCLWPNTNPENKKNHSNR